MVKNPMAVSRTVGLLILLLCVATARQVVAQGGDGSLRGTVKDSQGGALPGVTVTATCKCKKAGVTNNVEIDDRGLIYGADRAGGGLHILRLTGAAKEIVSRPASN